MESQDYSLSYYGKGSELFKIQIVNTILCIFTLGLYYPWAKARTRQYLYSQTTFQNEPFVFTGTGKEMFKGFIILIGLVIGIYASTIAVAMFLGMPLAVLLFYIAFLSLIPVALNGAFRYRMAKSKWKSINFQYTGNLKELMGIFYSGLFFTIITIGFYGPWLAMQMRRYIIDNIKLGDADFTYLGNGGDYFVLNLKGYLLTIVTLGIYAFWWQKDLFDYFVNNLRMSRNDDAVFFLSTATGGKFFNLLAGNLLIIIFTLGFGVPWATTRTLTFYAKHSTMSGTIDMDGLHQAPVQEYSSAVGDDMAGMFDIGAAI